MRSARSASYLLDTHIIVWMDRDPGRIPLPVRATLDASPALYFSAASAWEIAIKRTCGKMGAQGSLSAAAARLDLIEVAMNVVHGEVAGALPMHHTDPFDRMLVAQAQIEHLVLVTADRFLRPYDVELLLV